MVSEDITVRNPRLEWREPSARAWFGGNTLLSNWINAFSTTFPAGERFFMDAVRHYYESIAEPRLREQVRGFLGQEGMHAREHERFNERLAEQGYPVAWAEAKVRAVLGWLERNESPGTRLAVTCALEHFTTILSTAMLASPAVHAAMPEEHARLWRWHWVEELEHKSVAFDLYREIGGRYLDRVLVMALTSLVLWPLVAWIALSYQVRDGKLFALRDWGRTLIWALIRPGVLLRALPRYFAYYRPGYHPSQNPDEALLSAWRAKL